VIHPSATRAQQLNQPDSRYSGFFKSLPERKAAEELSRLELIFAALLLTLSCAEVNSLDGLRQHHAEFF
jgi:hypothetical protein